VIRKDFDRVKTPLKGEYITFDLTFMNYCIFFQKNRLIFLDMMIRMMDYYSIGGIKWRIVDVQG